MSERPDPVENSEAAAQRPAVLDDHHKGAAAALSSSLDKVYERHSGTPVTCHQSAGRQVAPVRYARTHTHSNFSPPSKNSLVTNLSSLTEQENP